MIGRTALALLVAAGSAAHAAPVAAADAALLIGIDDYSGARVQDPDGTVVAVNDLSGTVNDVAAVRRLLEDGFGVAPDAIRELTNRAATRQAMLDALDELASGTVPGDRVFVHFSGHGAQVRDFDGDETDDRLDEVLVAADADCFAGRGLALERCDNVLHDDELGERLDRLRGRHVLVLVDSCHSGTATRGMFTRPDDEPDGGGGTRLLSFDLPPPAAARSAFAAPPSRGAARLVEPGANRIVLSAVAAGQLAAEIVEPGAGTVGLFSHRLVEGLLEGSADADRDGEVSFAELLTHVKGESVRYCEARPGHEACRAGGVTPQAEIDPSLMAAPVLGFGRGDATGTDDGALEPGDVAASLPARNGANLRVSIGPDPEFRLGEPMTLGITAERDGLLLVLDRDASGALTALYPSPGDEAARPDGRPLGWVRAGHEVTMPDAYSGEQWPMGEPLGGGTIVAVLAEDSDAVAPVVERLVEASRAFAPVGRTPEDWLGRLYEALEAPVATGDDAAPTRASRWSIATADYRVGP